MSWKIVTDSSADLTPDFKPAQDIRVEEVPLTIRVGVNEYIDDATLDTAELLKAMQNEKQVAKTACPAPGQWAKAFEDADDIIAVTMSSKISGTNNAAQLGRDMVLEEYPDKNIHIVDSLSTSCAEMLIAEKAEELIAEGKPFKDVVQELEAYRDSLQTLFVLENYDNLIKNGRLNKLVGKLAKKLNIRIVGEGHNGELKVLHKARGEAKAYAKMVEEMPKKKDLTGAKVVIGESNNKAGATAIKHLIEKKYPQIDSVRIIPLGGVNSFYAEDGGIILAY